MIKSDKINVALLSASNFFSLTYSLVKVDCKDWVAVNIFLAGDICKSDVTAPVWVVISSVDVNVGIFGILSLHR
mgnify:CR=1 FL=1